MRRSSEQADETVERDLPCARCGYCLRGLPFSGSCPECAELISTSLKGDLLRFADPHWLKTINLGARWLRWGYQSFVLVFLLNLISLGLGVAAHAFLSEYSSVTRAIETVWTILTYVWIFTPLLIGLGLWLLTAPEPRADMEIEPPLTRLLAGLVVPAFGLYSFIFTARAAITLSALAELFFVHILFLIVVGHVWTLRRHLARLNRRIEKPGRILTLPSAWHALLFPALIVLLFWIGPFRWQTGWVMPTAQTHRSFFVVTALYWLWYVRTAQQFGVHVRKEHSRAAEESPGVAHAIAK